MTARRRARRDGPGPGSPVAGLQRPPRLDLVSEATTTPDGASRAAQGPQTLVLEGFPSTDQVRLLGPNAGTTNRYVLATTRRHVQQGVWDAVREPGIRPVPPPARLTLRYVFSDARHRDADNFAIVAKSVVDGLVKAGILAGDNAARLSERVEFVKEKGARRLEIVMEHAAERRDGSER